MAIFLMRIHDDVLADIVAKVQLAQRKLNQNNRSQQLAVKKKKLFVHRGGPSDPAVKRYRSQEKKIYDSLMKDIAATIQNM